MRRVYHHLPQKFWKCQLEVERFINNFEISKMRHFENLLFQFLKEYSFFMQENAIEIFDFCPLYEYSFIYIMKFRSKNETLHKMTLCSIITTEKYPQITSYFWTSALLRLHNHLRCFFHKHWFEVSCQCTMNVPLLVE